MSKKKKQHAAEERKDLLESISERKKNLIALIVILIPLLYFYLPWQLDGMRPVGTDYLANKGQTHLWVEWQKQHGETVLWNPNIFCGEPIYAHRTPQIIDAITILKYLGKIFYWVFWQMLVGALGVYFLLRYKKIPWYLALIAAVGFVLLPDWMALVGEGHNSKLRAIMSLPWLVLSFEYLFEKKSWLAAGLFALAFSWINRTHHFQIVFYGILLLFFLYIYPTLELLIKKRFADFGNLLLKFGVALVLVFMMSAQPLFTTSEYAKYSTRGGNPVKLGKEAQTARKAGGVSFDYATQWSFSPNELLSFFIPHFRGGVQAETYDETLYPQLRGRQVPGYWGEKPFNGNYASLSMILFLFALIGAIFYRRDKFVLAMSLFVIFTILLSFGRHFPSLYGLFFYHLPYFSKFRAPSMILNITFIVILWLSVYGLKAVIFEAKKEHFRWILGVFIAGLLILVMVFFYRGSYAYSTPLEVHRYDVNTLAVIKNIRQEFLLADLKKEFIYVVLASVALLAFLFKKLKKEHFVGLVLLLASFEIFGITNRAYKSINLNNPEQLENTEFRRTPISAVLSGDKSNMRAIVLGREFTSNHYAYYYPLITGYSAIKLQAIQDIFDHNLYAGNSPDRINWKVVNMLSGKYVISSSPLRSLQLNKLAEDKSRGEILYLNPSALPKAYFVKALRKFETPEALVLFMNKTAFEPANMALTVSPKDTATEYFTGKGSVRLLSYNPNDLSFEVETDSAQFLAIAEMYYPKGWTANIDGKKTPLLRINHVMRGVRIHPGKHVLALTFQPRTYFVSVSLVWLGNIATLLLVVVALYFELKRRSKQENDV
jgi:hypothetical protein